MKSLILVCAALAGFVLCATCTKARDESNHSASLEKVFFRDVPGPELHDGRLRIFNGNIATVGQFPFYVAVYVDLSSFCGGSLIHPKWVLTAAHCVSGATFWTMFMGATSMQLPLEKGREVHVSRGGILHPKYDSEALSHDVGLVQLLHPVSTLTDRIGLVRLTPPKQDYTGRTATVAGFGAIDDRTATISDVLRYTSMPVVSLDVCYDRYGSADDSQLCLATDEVGSSSCSGDSGGPLVIYDDKNVATQIGATSYGAKAGCSLGLPVGFSNLANFIGWIEETTGVPYPFDAQS